jgi:hypothetical protein
MTVLEKRIDNKAKLMGIFHFLAQGHFLLSVINGAYVVKLASIATTFQLM